jgi:hypothetical protein
MVRCRASKAKENGFRICEKNKGKDGMMMPAYDLSAMTQKIKTLRQTAEDLKAISGGIAAAERNVDRLLAVVRLLELDFCDIAEL